MIRLCYGNVGSGKTASAVRWMKNRPNSRIYTNIEVSGRGFSHVVKLKPEMIIKKEKIGEKRTGEPKYKYKLNVEYWKEMRKKYGQMDVVIDEAHIFFNPRRAMSHVNVIMSDFLALLRRIVGNSEGSDGELILITQLQRRLDPIAKDMSTHVQYHIHHYNKLCSKCRFSWYENNEVSMKYEDCPCCGHWNVKKYNNTIEVFDFKDNEKFKIWIDYGNKTYYNRYVITDIREIFGNYDTIQWGDLLSDY